MRMMTTAAATAMPTITIPTITTMIGADDESASSEFDALAVVLQALGVFWGFTQACRCLLAAESVVSPICVVSPTCVVAGGVELHTVSVLPVHMVVTICGI